MALYLVRHAQKQKPPFDATRLSYQQYTKSVSLTEEGRRTALKIGRYLTRITTSASMIASDYIRAQETALIIGNECGFGFITDRRLGERVLCDDNFKVSEIKTMNERSLEDWSWSAPGGESMNETALRLKTAIDHAAPSADTIVVSHSRAIQAYIGTYIDGEQSDEFRSPDPGFIIKYGDIVRIEGNNLEVIHT